MSTGWMTGGGGWTRGGRWVVGGMGVWCLCVRWGGLGGAPETRRVAGAVDASVVHLCVCTPFLLHPQNLPPSLSSNPLSLSLSLLSRISLFLHNLD